MNQNPQQNQNKGTPQPESNPLINALRTLLAYFTQLKQQGNPNGEKGLSLLQQLAGLFGGQGGQSQPAPRPEGNAQPGARPMQPGRPMM